MAASRRHVVNQRGFDARQVPPYDFADALHGRRFFEDIRESRGAQLQRRDCVDFRTGGDGNRIDSAFAQRKRQFRAADIRQAAVDQQQVETSVRCQRRRAGGRARNDAAALRHGRIEKTQRNRIVVDDPNTRLRCGYLHGGRMRNALDRVNALVSCRPFSGAGA